MKLMNSKIKSFFTNNLTRTISLSFFMVIFIGSILLSLPIANKGTPIPYLDHLFVATSATSSVCAAVSAVSSCAINFDAPIVSIPKTAISANNFLMIFLTDF